jgi:hypothetical protein
METTKVLIEAGEITIAGNDALTPSRLHKLADEGWSITHAESDGDTCKLFVVRWPRSAKPTVGLVVHTGGSRCPRYCSCHLSAGQEKNFTV